MVGIFQLLGLSFLFWAIVGCIRFIFERISRLRILSESASRSALFLAALCGVGVSVGLTLMLDMLLSMRVVNDAEVFGALLLLLFFCIALGGYSAARINTRETHFAAFLASIASYVAFIQLSSTRPLMGLSFTAQDVAPVLIGGIVAVGLGFLSAGLARRMNARDLKQREKQRVAARGASIRKDEVAILIAAHNEEVSIAATIESLLQSVEPHQIYIGSDGSKDKTVEIARSFGAHVDDIQPNRGKAGALTYVIEENKLLSRYKAIFLIDADIKVDSLFIERALPHFDDPEIAAVSGYFVAIWPKHYVPRFELLVTAYRIRLWRILQFFVRYGQTWKHLNVSPIIPGGGSIYRTSVLQHIRINTPGLVIEDFNMTFEVRHKNLGKVAFEPRAYLYDQEPYSVGDFIKQIKRWYLGYFQTMRRHGFWISWFCFFTYLFTFEMLVSAIIFLLTPFMALELLLSHRDLLLINFGIWGYPVTLLNIILAIFVIDYIITVGVAIVEKKPLLLLYGILFYPLRFIESAIFLWMLPQAFRAKSTGQWVSPKRVMFEQKT